jgi:predicted nuclease of predicted toxin-antitoxin system
VKLREFALLTDQNIHSDVVAFLVGEGFDVVDVGQAGLIGVDDATILAHANFEGRVVLTHDADFGTLAIPQGTPFVGIVYLRPGHVGPQPTIESFKRLLAADPDLNPPFLVVVKRTTTAVTIRIRQAKP